ncbi:DSD1 family PLP-dependent enzyme [Acinetobacter kookii]|uniref:D-serine deaminase, pyridoxal phosphate-dependent n=1 Tax=Acinetobacter kookii TaxID=1226327 RepID=A0A1G6HLI9_9GAMM|nr:alanine racemase [Acinetobacter kookii]SDB94316.1 D-serine deaminase, pyridoxal phosphate-dependent [Acinetobacter kookii]
MQFDYFQQLTQDLQQQGTGTPQLILDLAAYQHNLDIVQPHLSAQLKPRLVVKSLASLSLLKLASEKLNTRRFMLFHLPHIFSIHAPFPQADILLGKPMPIHAVEQFYQAAGDRQPDIQWLIDDLGRLQQYLQLAQWFNICLNVNIEIDVGLHRGGVQNPQQFRALLKLIQQHSAHLKFTGLMGYDAHVAKLPRFLKSAEKSYQQSQQSYQQYIDIIRQQFPNLWHEDLCFNGGGSPTFMQHCQQSVCNDLAFGSLLLKPGDFELASLAELQCALWIATPVLKVLRYSQLPGLEVLNHFPHKYKALFVYGGYWQADYLYPEKSKLHGLYGRSSNQEMLLVPKSCEIDRDDYVFLRPTQSEAVIPQFAQLYAYAQGKFEAWDSFRE